jgi:hypothetical protein
MAAEALLAPCEPGASTPIMADLFLNGSCIRVAEENGASHGCLGYLETSIM